MQCQNCGYIFFQPSKKCACCSAPYAPAPSSIDVGQENLFTIFEMAPGEGGISGGMDVSDAPAGVEDYDFTDDFDSGDTEYGVDENVLDLSDAEAAGYGISDAIESSAAAYEFDTSGMDETPAVDDAGPDDFDLNLSNDLTDNETDSAETLELEPEAELEVDEAAAIETVEPDTDDAMDAGDTMDADFGGGFDEVEGLGFGFDESPAEETPEVTTDEISLDEGPEAEISLEPELDIGDEQPSIELSDEPSLELDEEALDTGEMDTFEDEPSLELPDDLELSEEPELMEPSIDDESTEMEEDGGIEFDLDSVNLDEPEEVSYEVPEEPETGDEEAFMDLDGLEMETPEEPEDEDLTK